MSNLWNKKLRNMIVIAACLPAGRRSEATECWMQSSLRHFSVVYTDPNDLIIA
jgi:hypothetical protein